MGVLGLWNLIEESGTRVNIENLQGKILAVDLSIWINQAIKGFRDKDGRALENAHILGLFHRICKLLFYGVKPIFVFDGESPLLKSRTAQRRREKKQKSLDKAKTMSLNVIEKYVLSQYGYETGPLRPQRPTTSQSNLKSPKKLSDVYEDFVELTKSFENKIDEDDCDSNDEAIDENAFSFQMGDCQNIRNIDIKSESFLSLSAVARYEVLQEMRESYKGRKNPFPEQLPTDSEEFSSFQMGKLLKKRNLQEEIDKVIEELNGHDDEEDNKEWIKGIDFDGNIQKILGGKLASDEKTKFLLFKKILLKKKNRLEQKDSFNEIETEQSIDEEVKDEEVNETNSIAFELPNKLLDQPESFSDSQRIEHLSQLKGSKINNFNSAKLMGHLEENLNKVQSKDSTNVKNNVKLSDDEESSEDDEADLIDPEEYDQQILNEESKDFSKNLFQELILPYKTDYSLTIDVPVDIAEKSPQKCEESSFSENEAFNEIFKEKSQNISKDENKDNEKGGNEIEMAEMNVIKYQNKKIPTIVSNEEIEKFQSNRVPNVEVLEEDKEENKQKNTVEMSATIEPEHPLEDIISNKDKIIEPINIEKLIQDSKQANTIARQAMSVSHQMLDDCQKLLMLFGCPFIISPAEAEAQCATLEELGLCEGIITDDSDIFLFGGQTVYKNFFSNDKFITQYRAADLERFYGLNRSKIICLGMMCGTDYTVGIDGIGPVNGLEILGEFPGENLKPLKNYAEWYHKRKAMKNVPPENKIRSKLLRFKLPMGFPNRVVYDAYYNANTDRSTKPFSWSMPQLHELRMYSSRNFGWSIPKADSLLLPVIKKFNKKQTQQRIEMFFPAISKNASVNDKLKVNRSKRLNAAIHQSIALSQAQTNKKKSSKKRRTSEELNLSEESSSDDEK